MSHWQNTKQFKFELFHSITNINFQLQEPDISALYEYNHKLNYIAACAAGWELLQSESPYSLIQSQTRQPLANIMCRDCLHDCDINNFFYYSFRPMYWTLTINNRELLFLYSTRHTALRFCGSERKLVEKIDCSGHNENSIVPAVHVYHANSVIIHEKAAGNRNIAYSFVLNRVGRCRFFCLWKFVLR